MKKEYSIDFEVEVRTNVFFKVLKGFMLAVFAFIVLIVLLGMLAREWGFDAIVFPLFYIYLVKKFFDLPFAHDHLENTPAYIAIKNRQMTIKGFQQGKYFKNQICLIDLDLIETIQASSNNYSMNFTGEIQMFNSKTMEKKKNLKYCALYFDDDDFANFVEELNEIVGNRIEWMKPDVDEEEYENEEYDEYDEDDEDDECDEDDDEDGGLFW